MFDQSYARPFREPLVEGDQLAFGELALGVDEVIGEIGIACPVSRKGALENGFPLQHEGLVVQQVLQHVKDYGFVQIVGGFEHPDCLSLHDLGHEDLFGPFSVRSRRLDLLGLIGIVHKYPDEDVCVNGDHRPPACGWPSPWLRGLRFDSP